MDDLERMAQKDLHQRDLFSSPLTENPDEVDTNDLMDHSLVMEPPSGSHEGTVIWLHSLGDKFESVKHLWEMIAPSNVRVVAPRAPLLPITALDEAEERAWFDYEEATMKEGMEEDFRLIELHAHMIKSIIDRETKDFPSKKVIIAGFGQGGSMALHCGLAYPKQLGGIVSFSGFVSLPEEYPDRMCDINKETPILAIHGNSDQVVPIDFAKGRYNELKEFGCKVELRESFYLEHNTNEEQLFGMQMWLTETLKI